MLLEQMLIPIAIATFLGVLLIVAWARYVLLYLGSEHPLEIFFDEFKWALPCIGTRLKAAYYKQYLEKNWPTGEGSFAGHSRSWSFDELRTTQAYEDFARDFGGTPVEFWKRFLKMVVVSLLITLAIVALLMQFHGHKVVF